MYVVLTKNNNNTWDAIHDLNLKPGTDLYELLDSEVAKGIPLVGMNVTSHKSKAIKGATWNGSSFSGGELNESTPLDSDEFWSNVEKYSFLSDNKIVVSFTMGNDNANSSMFKAAFAGETILVKNASKPFDKVGKTFYLNGVELKPVEPA
jgi:hypothetical protein